jgi:hypothetical protein
LVEGDQLHDVERLVVLGDGRDRDLGRGPGRIAEDPGRDRREREGPRAGGGRDLDRPPDLLPFWRQMSRTMPFD